MLHLVALRWAYYLDGLGPANSVLLDILISLGADKTLCTTRGHTAYDLSEQGFWARREAEDRHAEIRRVRELLRV